jgi:hypothetical protein
METSSLGAIPGAGKWRSKAGTLVSIVLAVLITFAIYLYFHHKNPKVNAGTDLTKSQIASDQENAAQAALDNKNYQTAADYYYSAASSAYGQKDYSKAKDLLDKCIKDVPDKYIGWYVYQMRASNAKAMNDKTLEKSSLEKAISKASASDSGADPSVVSLMQKDLQGL